MEKIVFIVAKNRNSIEGLHWCLHLSKTHDVPIRFVCVDPAKELTQLIADTERQFRTFAVKFETAVADDDYITTCITEGRVPNVKVLVVVEKQRSFLKKIFGQSDLASLKDAIPCEIKVYSSRS